MYPIQSRFITRHKYELKLSKDIKTAKQISWIRIHCVPDQCRCIVEGDHTSSITTTSSEVEAIPELYQSWRIEVQRFVSKNVNHLYITSHHHLCNDGAHFDWRSCFSKIHTIRSHHFNIQSQSWKSRKIPTDSERISDAVFSILEESLPDVHCFQCHKGILHQSQGSVLHQSRLKRKNLVMRKWKINVLLSSWVFPSKEEHLHDWRTF